MSVEELKKFIISQLNEVKDSNKEKFPEEDIIINEVRFQTWNTGSEENPSWSCLADNSLETKSENYGIIFKSSKHNTEYESVVSVLGSMVKNGLTRYYKKQ